MTRCLETFYSYTVDVGQSDSLADTFSVNTNARKCAVMRSSAPFAVASVSKKAVVKVGSGWKL